MQLTDPGWESEHFDVLGPATSATYDVIEPGASERLEFVVVPRVSGQLLRGPLAGDLRRGQGPSHQRHLQRPPRIPILSITDKHIETAIGVGAVVTLGFCTTLDDCDAPQPTSPSPSRSWDATGSRFAGRAP